MAKLYVGNLDAKIADSTVRALFEERGLHPSNIIIKKGYAFVDCPNQQTADRAIDYLNGYNLLGSIMQVEPSVPKQRRRTNKVSIRNLPSYVNPDEINAMCQKYGAITNIEREDDGQFVVTFDNSDIATEAINGLNGQDFQGQTIKAAPVVFNNRRNGNNGRDRGDRGGGFNGGRPGGRPQPPRRDNYPLLRLLVNSDLVGAVIGTGGTTITDITKRTKARVDVLRQDKSNKIRLPETPIYMYGNPENVSSACKEIMKVLQEESREKLKEDFTLKMLAEDKYCGSIIGRSGKNIRAIREKTDSKITISQQNPNYPFNWDRIITIKGELEGMSEAEKDITSRLRQCTVSDREKNEYSCNAMMPPPPPYMTAPAGMHHHHGHTHGGPGMYPHGMMRNPYLMPHHNYPVHQHPGNMYGNSSQYPNLPPNMMPQAPPEEETFIKVPDGAASVIIGPKGNNIRHIKNESKAYIHIDPEKKDKNDPTPPRIPDGIPLPKDPKERVVTIRGNWDAQWKAHFYVFEKLKSEGFAGNDEVKLTCLMKVPNSCIGRIIGKLGHNVKNIQKQTGAIVKLPEDTYYPPAGDYKFVEITGSYTATQAAMSRIKSKIPGTNSGYPPKRNGTPPLTGAAAAAGSQSSTPVAPPASSQASGNGHASPSGAAASASVQQQQQRSSSLNGNETNGDQ